MSARPENSNARKYNLLPSVDELVRGEVGRSLATEAGTARLTQIARNVIDELRGEMSAGELSTANHTKASIFNAAELRLSSLWELQRASGLRRVINATGVIVHTNLGRAPLSQGSRQAVLSAAGYCNVEFDILAGRRGRRGQRVETMLVELTGAEDALVVNNCAAAAFLVLSTFAAGRDVIISRGELVEIGGDFRVPDVLTRSGAVLKEVGTTNRTKVADYEKAIDDGTAMILKVHPSNYRIVGYTASPSLEDLAEVARRKNVIFYEDAGSGAVADLSHLGLGDEPSIRASIAAGADVVTFSGDKLLGGPQAGIIVGRKTLVERLRRDPLYRALRVDKLIIAALEATLEAHLCGKAVELLPVLKMLAIGERESKARASGFVSRLANASLKLDLVAGTSAVGGGSAPLTQPATSLISVSHSRLSAEELDAKLRGAEPPVITRIGDGKVLIDLRTVSETEEDQLAATINAL